MAEPGNNIYDSDPRRLADLIDEAGDERRIWRPTEIASLLKHQLAAPVEFDLGAMTVSDAAKVCMLTESQGLLLKSFGELFRHSCPPLELLRMVKQFAKALMNSPHGPLPQEIAKVLYFSSIVVARIRLRERITELEDDALARALTWLLEQPWLNGNSRMLFTEGLRFLALEKGKQS